MTVRAATATTSRITTRRNRRRADGQPGAETEASTNAPFVARLLLRAADLRGSGTALLERVKGPFVFCTRLVLLGAVVAGAVSAGRLIEKHVRSSPSFQTRLIELDGNRRLTREELLAVAGLAVGRNIFEVGPEQAQRALQAHPWVASATVQRRLPGNYFVEVQERRPVAVLALEGLYLVGADGSVFKRLEASDPADLPVITGLEREAFATDRAYRTSALVNAVALLHDYRDVGLFRRKPIAEIHAEPGERFSLYVGEDATLVRLGQRPFRKKLGRFRKVVDQLDRQKASAEYVYLDNDRRPDRVTVRLR